MRHLTFIAAISILCIDAEAQQFDVSGTTDVFVISQSVLEKTPKWEPTSNTAIPVSVAKAMQIGCDYHNKQDFTGFIELFKWNLSGCTLVREDNQRWYWVVQFRGEFSPREMLEKKGNPPGGFSYAGPKTIYHRIPVLLTGKLAPTKLDFLPKAVKIVENDGEPSDALKDRASRIDNGKSTPGPQ